MEMRDEFILKWFMNKQSIRPGQYTEDLLYFFEEFNDAIRNGEIFEQAFMELYGITYNKNLTGADGHKTVGKTVLTYEAKKEMKSKDLKLDGKSAWSIHCVATQIQKQDDPNFYLLQFGFKHGQLVYALLIKMDQTSIIKGKKIHPTSKMLASWKDFKDAKDIQPLFLNRDLIKQWASNDFKNWLLSLKETDPSVTGVDIRSIVGLAPDEGELYYRQGETISKNPKFSATGNTCLAISKTTWENQLKPLFQLMDASAFGFSPEKSLQIGNDMLFIRKVHGEFQIRSSIDTTKTKWRPLDSTIQI